MTLRPDQALIANWITRGSRVLDLGCGDGALLAALQSAQHVTGFGIEIDAENIIRCIAAGVNVIQSDLDAGLSDFDDNSFDYVIMTQTLQAVRFPNLLLQEMLRVGREGIVTFPNMGHWKCRLQLAGGRMPIAAQQDGHWYDAANIHLCTIGDFENLCRSSNIEICERTMLDSRHRVGFGMRVYPNLLAEIALYRIRNHTGLMRGAQ